MNCADPPFQALGQAVVHHKTHIRLVDAHAKSNGGNNHLTDSSNNSIVCMQQATCQL